MHNLPKNLKELREERGLTQSELARRLGYKSAVTIAQWETATRTPELGNLIALAKYFSVSLDFLIGATE